MSGITPGMRIVFMGSPEPVLSPLQALVDSRDHHLVGVISQPARPVGRKGVLTDPPVAAFAKAKGLPLFQPEKASAPEFLATLRELRPDVVITAAYGQILSDEFLKIPTRATINIHPSLLPLYRGATPVPAALLDGARTSGVTILFTVKALDAGAIILQDETPVGADETAGALTDRYFQLGAAMLPKALAKLADPAFKGTPQDDSRVTHCKKIKKTDGLVDWTQAAETIYNRFRAFEPWPGSYTFCQGKRLSLVEVRFNPARGAVPGSVGYLKTQDVLTVGCGSDLILVSKIRPAGGKDLTAGAFWNGLKDKTDVRFTREETGP